VNNIGAEVYWNDPDDGICSGWYEIEEVIDEETFRLKNESGSEVEALIEELS
jgi:hypothetical protein